MGADRASVRLAIHGSVFVHAALTKEELEEAHCWEPLDQVPNKPQMTEFRRRLRYHQARWREANGHPIGSQPIAPRPGDKTRLVGSRMPLDYAKKTGANFISPGALKAARERTSTVEPNQSSDHQRLWADLLWSQALAFNLFGDLQGDLSLADRAVHIWWPDAPGTVIDVRFAHSPGRLDRAYLNSLRDFDAAFVMDMGKGRKGIIAIATKYFEWAKPEIARPSNWKRYVAIAERSGVFRPGVIEPFKGRNGLCLTWLEHLLVLSMLQHASSRWDWGRYVLVYPAGNLDFAEAAVRYRQMLKKQSTFGSMTLEELLDARALRPGTTTALHRRYLSG
jgi:hypothetical protein